MAFIDKDHLALAVQESNEGMTKKGAQAIVATMLAQIEASLLAGTGVKLAGIGMLEVKPTKARMGRNPKTGAAVQIKESRQVKFKLHSGLKKQVKETTVAPKRKVKETA